MVTINASNAFNSSGDTISMTMNHRNDDNSWPQVRMHVGTRSDTDQPTPHISLSVHHNQRCIVDNETTIMTANRTSTKQRQRSAKRRLVSAGKTVPRRLSLLVTSCTHRLSCWSTFRAETTPTDLALFLSLFSSDTLIFSLQPIGHTANQKHLGRVWYLLSVL
jgi:hypothetical protein